MKTLLFFLFTSLSFFNFAQFSTESQVVTYMSSKEFYSESYQMTVSYEFIPKYNTYGIVCVNKNSEKFYYINCTVKPYGSSADISGMSSEGGGNFGFRLYEGRISVQGNDFYLKGKMSSSNSRAEPGLSTANHICSSSCFKDGFSTGSTSAISHRYRYNFPPKLPDTKPVTKDEIMLFQNWLDYKHPGWLNGKSLSKGSGYGIWGTSTQKAWDQYGTEYISN